MDEHDMTDHSDMLEDQRIEEEIRRKEICKAVARFVRVPLSQVEFRQRHDYIMPPVCTLEVQDKGLYFAMDVQLDFDVETFVVPYGEKVKTPRDVHRACRNYLIKTGRVEIERD